MSSVMRKAMVYLGLSDDDYDEYGSGDDRRPRSVDVRSGAAQQPYSGGNVGAGRPGPDYSRGTSTIRPLSRQESARQESVRQGMAHDSATATMTRPTVVRPIESSQESSVRVHVIEPIEFSDAQELGDRLRAAQPVIVTLTDVEPELSRRIIDFCSGATYVLGGTMERVAKNVFLLTPSNVEVSAEEKQRLRERGLYPA